MAAVGLADPGHSMGDPLVRAWLQGSRDYEWAWVATASPWHRVLIRHSVTDPSDLAFYYCHAPTGRPVSLPS